VLLTSICRSLSGSRPMRRNSLTDNGWRRVRRQLLCGEPSRPVMQSIGRAGSLVLRIAGCVAAGFLMDA
jgi:hypothetical protein